MPTISVKYGPFSVSELEALVESLAQSIGIVSVDFSTDFKIVVTEDKVAIIGGEKDGVVGFPGDSEIEGIFSVFELDS